MRRLWRFNEKLYAPGTGAGVILLAAIYLLGYKACFEVPMAMRFTKSAIRNGEVTGFYEAQGEKPKPPVFVYLC